MPSFDVVSEVDVQEVRNAIDQAHRELTTRFDFKGTDTTVEFKDSSIEVESASEERLKAATQVLEEKLVKRKVSLKALDYGKVEEASRGRARQKATLQVGINDEKAREIGKYIKGLGLKGVQHQVQGTQLRVTGKKRDDLQSAIQSLREHDFGVPLDFTNFRDDVRAVEERAHRNYCDYLRWTSHLDPGAALLDQNGVLAVRGSSDFPTSRTAVRAEASLPAEQWVEAVDEFLAPGGKTACVNARVGLDDDITDVLLERGFREWSTSPEMVCQHALESRPVPEDVTVRFASSPADISAYARVVAEAFAHLMLPEDISLAAIDNPEEFLGADSAVALAEIDGTAVAGAQIVSFGGGEIAYVSWVACADAARGRGLGDTVTRAVTNEAFARGANLVTLEASHFGEHTYARMGYRELYRYRMLLRL